MKVYVASSWRNRYQADVVQALRVRGGHDVYDFKNPPGKSGFGWHEIDALWQEWTTAQYVEALSHPRAIEGFGEDIRALAAADAVVLVLPCGRSAHLEAGWGNGAGKQLYIYSPEQCEPELMYRMARLITDDVNEIVAALQGIRGAEVSA